MLEKFNTTNLELIPFDYDVDHDAKRVFELTSVILDEIYEKINFSDFTNEKRETTNRQKLKLEKKVATLEEEKTKTNDAEKLRKIEKNLKYTIHEIDNIEKTEKKLIRLKEKKEMQMAILESIRVGMYPSKNKQFFGDIQTAPENVYSLIKNKADCPKESITYGTITGIVNSILKEAKEKVLTELDLLELKNKFTIPPLNMKKLFILSILLLAGCSANTANTNISPETPAIESQVLNAEEIILENEIIQEENVESLEVDSYTSHNEKIKLYAQWANMDPQIANYFQGFNEGKIDCIATATDTLIDYQDLISTLIANNEYREVQTLDIYTPEFLMKLDKRIVDFTGKYFFAKSLCHVGDNVHVTAGILYDDDPVKRSKECFKRCEENPSRYALLVIHNEKISMSMRWLNKICEYTTKR